jgi:hypothetical protein
MFVSGMKEQIMPLFRNIHLVCGGDESSRRNNGCKLQSNVAKAWSRTVNDLSNKAPGKGL